MEFWLLLLLPCLLLLGREVIVWAQKVYLLSLTRHQVIRKDVLIVTLLVATVPIPKKWREEEVSWSVIAKVRNPGDD